MTEARGIQRVALPAIAAVLVILLGCNALRSSPTPSSAPTDTVALPATITPIPETLPSHSPSPTSTTAPSATPPPTGSTEGTPTPSVLTSSPLPSPTTPPTPTPTPVVTPAIPGLQLPDIAGVVELVRPSVVSVGTEVLVRDVFGRVFRDPRSGSGVLFDSQGYVLTNNHVVQNATDVTVTLDDGRQFEAEVVGADELTDLAVLKISGVEFSSVFLADPSTVRVGDWVIAIGNALALPGGPTVTVGVISALDRAFPIRSDLQLYGLIQTDASINPGNSGGPLLNLEGELVGINTAVARGDRAGREVEGIGFAVGMDTAVPVAQQLVENGSVQWAWLGVVLDDLEPQMATQVGVPIREGVLIANVAPDSPAWRGGIRRGDVVVAMGGQEVSTVRHLIRLLRHEHKVGEKVEIKIFREKRPIDLQVTLGERPEQ